MSINDYPAKLTDDYYYVRTAWEDESTQIGQYRTLKSAIAKADATWKCEDLVEAALNEAAEAEEVLTESGVEKKVG